MFVAIKNVFCRDKSMLVLSRQKTCRDKIVFCRDKIIYGRDKNNTVAAPANDSYQLFCCVFCEVPTDGADAF